MGGGRCVKVSEAYAVSLSFLLTLFHFPICVSWKSKACCIFLYVRAGMPPGRLMCSFYKHDCSLKYFRTVFRLVGEVGIGGVVLYTRAKTGHLTGDSPPSIFSPWLTLVLIPFASPLKNLVTTANPAQCKSLD